jgi:hypothetical protein
MKRATVGLVAVLLAQGAGPAVALSCEIYDIRTAFWSYQEAEETYLLVQGAFFDIRPASPGDSGRADTFSTRFTGNKASGGGFDQPFETEVTLFFSDDTEIAGAEYNSADLALRFGGQAGLVWLEQTERGYEAQYGLCWPFIDSDPESVGPVLDCLAGRNCPKPG